MKKLIFAFVIALLLCACGGEETRQEYVGGALGLDLSAAEMLGEDDSHGGFHGDGETIIVLRVDDLSSGILDKEGWHELPLPESLEAYGEKLGPAESGYWYFFDRHEQASDPYDPSGVASRASRNFSLALYDPSTGLLSYYELDT